MTAPPTLGRVEVSGGEALSPPGGTAEGHQVDVCRELPSVRPAESAR